MRSILNLLPERPRVTASGACLIFRLRRRRQDPDTKTEIETGTEMLFDFVQILIVQGLLCIRHQKVEEYFDDNNDNHLWLTLPSHNDGNDVNREKSIAFSLIGRHRGLQDRKGTVDFLVSWKTTTKSWRNASKIIPLVKGGKICSGMLPNALTIVVLSLLGLMNSVALTFL